MRTIIHITTFPILFVYGLYIMSSMRRKYKNDFPNQPMAAIEWMATYSKAWTEDVLEQYEKNRIHFIILGILFWAFLVNLFL